jgi:hypothetical protein
MGSAGGLAARPQSGGENARASLLELVGTRRQCAHFARCGGTLRHPAASVLNA